MRIFLGFLFLTPLFLLITATLLFQIIKFFQKPKLWRKWITLHQKLPEIIFSDNQEKSHFFVRNIRNAAYNPAFEFENKVEYLNKKYNLDDIKKIWLYTNPYGFLQTHIIISFEFSNESSEKSFLTISYELRKIKPEGSGFLNTLYKNYESFYIIATDNDVIYVRTNIRKDEKVYLFELNLKEDQVKKVFLRLSNAINIYKKQAFFYRIFYRNCLTEVLRFFKEEKIFNYSFFDLLNLNFFLYKKKFIVGENPNTISFTDFLKKHEIKKI